MPMATVAMAPGLPINQSYSKDTLSTIPDPRTPSSTPDLARSDSTSPHPELSNEVATLSNKLIRAINHQTDLDDTLSETRHKLEAAQEYNRQLQHEAQEHNSLLASGMLAKRSDFEAELLRLKTSLADERKVRVKIEKEKRDMESELESLTTALFEEANQMVAAARKDARREKEVVERRNEQLQAQLNDAELLLTSHQEQLSEIKTQMQDRNDTASTTNGSSAPPTPGIDTSERMSKVFDALHLSPATPGGEDVPPSPPTSFTHLLHPVLRTDVQAYDDFHALLELSRKSHPSSRVTSATYAGLSGLGLSNLTNRESYGATVRLASNGSTSSLTASNTHPPSPVTPNVPTSTNSSVSSRDPLVAGTALRETPFYKRVLSEDLEPTLRLDLAPGLSWLARRSVINAMSDGKLVVEPMPHTIKHYQPACALCGEQGRGEKQARRHKFRTSESESAQRYPLCDYCLNRMRASCDFLGFLRMVRDGHWRTDGPEAEASAWEESVRLRERMFWSRIGGGVIPAFLKNRTESPRTSSEEEKAVMSPPGTSRPDLAAIHSTKPEVSSPLVHETSGEPFQKHRDTNRRRSPEVMKSEPKMIFSMGPEHHVGSDNPLGIINIPTQGEPKSPAPADEAGVGPPPLPEKDEPPRAVALEKQQRPLMHTLETSDTTPKRSSLSRTTTRSRGTSRTEGANGRPSIAQSVAARAAMFDKPSEDNAASDQLQSSLQASLAASLKGRSRSRGRGTSPAISNTSQEPLPTPKQKKGSGSGSIPGAFDF